MKYYLVGIKGCGMCALANALYQEGHLIRGADFANDFYTKSKLNNFVIDDIDNMVMDNSYFYIIGNAFKNHRLCSEIVDNYRYLYYPDFIAWHYKDYKQICIAGSHGKTTTSALVAHLLGECSYIIGDGSGGYSKNKVLVLESCEYRNTFLKYSPSICLVLNIDYDHPDFFQTEKDYIDSFNAFISKSSLSIINLDDKNLKKINKNSITYGSESDAYFKFDFNIFDNKMIINIDDEKYVFNYVGEFLAYDFVGAYAVAKLLGISSDNIKERLKSFKLPNRRLTRYYQNKITYICDYAHHPTEIKGVYESLKYQYKNNKIVCFFEPHTYSRTITFKEDFKRVLGLFDEVYLYRTFNSREKKNTDLDSKISDILGINVINEEGIINYPFNENQIYLFLGAGTIDNILRKILYERK